MLTIASRPSYLQHHNTYSLNSLSSRWTSTYSVVRDDWSLEERRLLIDVYQQYCQRWAGLRLYNAPLTNGARLEFDLISSSESPTPLPPRYPPQNDPHTWAGTADPRFIVLVV